MGQKVAYVTGGMGGIGTAICQRLHKDGFKVIAGCGPSRDYRKWLDEQAQDGVAQLAMSRSKLVFHGYAGFSALELNGNNSAVVVKAWLGALSLFGVDAVYDPEEPEATPSAATQFALRDSRLIVKGDTPYVLASCDEYSAKWLQGVFYTPYGLPGKVQRVLEANPNVKFVNGLPEKLAAVYYPARNA